MDGDRVGHLGRADDGGHVEVGKGRLRRTDANGLVGEKDVLGVEIGGGMHRHGLDAQFAARSENAERDLAAVGDDDFLDHRVIR